MRLLYLDIDTLRPDHLGCHGYARRTSPNIDALAARGIRFANVYASDVPCLPSRTALLTGRFGIHNGVVNHGGSDADPAIDGADRGFWARLQTQSFPAKLKAAGLRTVSVSSFAQRHSAYHWYAGVDEAYNVGSFGLETADEVFAIASDWLARNGRSDDWYLHVHLWDPHTPYRAAAAHGDPFAADPTPAWLTEDVRAAHWEGCGPHSARECSGWAPNDAMRARYPRQPQQIDSMAAVRAMFDGYDLGVRVADECAGRILNQLADLGVLDDTAVMVSSDHGETLGELNVYGDHQTADALVSHVPLILRWPALGDAGVARVLDAFHYQIDVTATIVELLGQRVPSRWDGEGFAASLRAGRDEGRDHLVVSQGAWTCQRGVRFDRFHYVFTWHDAFHLHPSEMLFDVHADPHEQRDLIASREDVARTARALLHGWTETAMPTAANGRDPLLHVLEEGGPFHTRGQLAGYVERLRSTGRGHLADRLLARDRPTA
jgi:arylsulfatase A-like enzyme